MHRTTHTFCQRDLFHNFDLEKLKFKPTERTRREIKAQYKYRDKNALIGKIFLSLMKMIVDDMVKEGITFHLPTKTIATMSWRKLPYDRFVKACQSGKFANVDYIQSNFSIYVPILKYYYRNTFREKDVIFDDTFKAQIDEKTTNGFKYC